MASHLSSQAPELKKTVEHSSPGPESLPSEIKLEILRHMLICPDPLSFTQLPLTKAEAAHEVKTHPKAPWRRKWFSDTLRLARWNHCKHDEPVAKALMSDFSALCLVSKDMRSICRGIFFRENSWVLHTTRSFDAIGWVVRYWGAEALGLMSNVRIEVHALFEPGYRALEIFVKAAKKGAMLRDLSVQWIEGSPPLQCARNAGATWHFHPMCRDHGLERNREGSRGLIVAPENAANYDEDDYGTKYLGPESEPHEWRTQEVVLLPLAELRCLAKARIEGTVTESWASWLETVMMTGESETVPKFEFQLEEQEAIRKLKGEATLEQ
jgi:hypothetical protein